MCAGSPAKGWPACSTDRRATALVGRGARGRALRGGPVRADQRPARRLRRVAGDDRAGRGLAARAVAAHLPAGAGRRLRRRGAAGAAGGGARLRPAVGGAAAGRRWCRCCCSSGWRWATARAGRAGAPRATGCPAARPASPDSVATTATFFTVAVRDHPRAARAHRRRAVTRGVRWSALGVGLVFGFLLTASGLGDYDTIHDGLLLTGPVHLPDDGQRDGHGVRRSRRPPPDAAAPGTRAGCRCRTTASSAGTSTAARSSGWASASARPAPG